MPSHFKSLSPRTPSVRVEHLSFSFDGGVSTLFDDVSFHLSAHAWCGLVGANGSGKSTLLELLAGRRSPDRGLVTLTPEYGAVELCPQRIAEEPPRVDDALGASLQRWLGRLGLPEAPTHSWPESWSPGLRKRFHLACSLAREPAVLLLDEPTNHLDGEAVRVLVDALRHHRGVGLVVSHDRAFLDELTGSTLRLVHGRVEWRRGGFSAAKAEWEREANARRDAHAEASRRLVAARRQLDERRRALEAATGQRNTRRRMRNKHDSDARGLGANFRVEVAEQAHAAAVKRGHQKQERLEQARPDYESVRLEPEVRSLFLRHAPCPKPIVARLRGDVPVARGQHLVITGPNGAGKTTVLREMLERQPVPAERLLVLPQELSAEEIESDLDVLHALERSARGKVLQLFDALGADPDRVLATASPSPGESRKLRLALGLGQEVWLAVLDEPTNHLDLPSIERLEAALTQFPGALVVSTHDRALGRAIAHQTWSLSPADRVLRPA